MQIHIQIYTLPKKHKYWRTSHLTDPSKKIRPCAKRNMFKTCVQVSGEEARAAEGEQGEGGQCEEEAGEEGEEGPMILMATMMIMIMTIMMVMIMMMIMMVMMESTILVRMMEMEMRWWCW